MNKVAPLFCRRQKNDNIFRAILNPNRWQARYLVLIAAGSCAKCGSDGREPKVHERKMDHAHKEVRPSAYISTHSLLYNTVLRRPFHRSRREHRKSSDKPPPVGGGSHDGLLYVFHTADRSLLRCVVGRVCLCNKHTRPLVRCRSPPKVQETCWTS